MTINNATDIINLAGNLKQTGRYHIGPCPFCGGRDRFNVKLSESGQLWICRKCSPDKYQDAAAFLMRLYGLSFLELLAQFGELPAQLETCSVACNAVSTSDRSPSTEWQRPALLTVDECCNHLRGRETADARAAYSYLEERRGLTPATMHKASLGFNPSWRQVGGRWLAPGITIPCTVNSELRYVQVRTTKRARRQAEKRNHQLGKYHSLPGSRLTTLYGADALLDADTAVVCEGEFDTLLLGQHLPARTAAVTMGSASALPRSPVWLRYFAAVQHVYLVMDNDAAGHESLARWHSLLPWATSLNIPDGHNDITDYWQAGGDLNEWPIFSSQSPPDRT